MSRSIPFTTQVTHMFQNVSSEERGEQKNILVSDFRKMFARQISKVRLHRRKLQSKVRKNVEVGAQR